MDDLQTVEVRVGDATWHIKPGNYNFDGRTFSVPVNLRERVLPRLISLEPAWIAEEVAEWLTEQLDDDSRAYGVIGPMDGRVCAFLKGGDVIVIDIEIGEVRPQ